MKISPGSVLPRISLRKLSMVASVPPTAQKSLFQNIAQIILNNQLDHPFSGWVIKRTYLILLVYLNHASYMGPATLKPSKLLDYQFILD